VAELGLRPRELAAAVHTGGLQRLGGMALLPGALEDVVRLLAALPQPFTLGRWAGPAGPCRRF
jgi:selenocysteine-specific elongation factor